MEGERKGRGRVPDGREGKAREGQRLPLKGSNFTKWDGHP